MTCSMVDAMSFDSWYLFSDGGPNVRQECRTYILLELPSAGSGLRTLEDNARLFIN